MSDLEATYLAATSKGTAPAARSMSALSDWCVARGSAALATAQALYDFITGYATPGSATYASPGTYSFTVPYFANLTAAVNGAGGGSSGGAAAPAGGTAAGGGATGGDSNTAGAGAGGGTGAWDQTSEKSGTYDSFGANGGAGSLAVKTFLAGALSGGAVLTIVVGGGGAPGSGAGNQRVAAAGATGSVTISWS